MGLTPYITTNEPPSSLNTRYRQFATSANKPSEMPLDVKIPVATQLNLRLG